MVISQYAMICAEGNYYILAKPENVEELMHYWIDFLKDIAILEQNVDMIFGGINPS